MQKLKLVVVAALGTTTVRDVGVAEVVVPATPLKNTTSLAGAGSKLTPLTVTVVPTEPGFGLRSVMAGYGMIVKLEGLVAV